MNPDFEIIDFTRFRPLVVANARTETLATGLRWGEGPVWFADLEMLLFSDIPNNRILRWVDGAPPTVFRAPSNLANGNTRDCEGRLVTCEHGGRRVTRTEHDGRITVLADRYEGKRLNAPNDVVVKSDGTVWFTDPDYGILSDFTGSKAESELGACNVFRLDPKTGALTIVTGEMEKPNGLAFSPDEKTLYVADSSASHGPQGKHHILAFPVRADGTVGRPEVCAVIEPGIPDGFRVDEAGNIWTSAGDGVHCYAPDGALIGKIRTPEVCANVTFGGPKRNRLFMTCASTVLAVFVGISGAQRP
jgi:gluconolactonase